MGAARYHARFAGSMTRFLHSADWQLGMTRHFLDEDAQARFTQARIDAVKTLARIATETGCEFAVVSGDVFEHNQLDRRTVARALDAMREFTVPLYLLPGNHDPLDAASVFRSEAFLQGKPDQVHVLESTGPIDVVPGVQVIGVPWTSKRPLEDLVAGALGGLAPAVGVTRVMVAHGAVDELSPDTDDPARIGLATVEQALAEGRIHYLALGDRHSLTSVGSTGRVWYPSAPEPTAFRELDAGKALVVEIGGAECRVTPHDVGTWRFEDREQLLDTDADLDAFEQAIDALPHRERTVVRVTFRGTLTLTQKARLDDVMARARDVFAGVDEWERHTDLAVRPDDTDFADLDVAGFAREAVDDLREMAEAPGADAATARDALSLLLRLAGRRA